MVVSLCPIFRGYLLIRNLMETEFFKFQHKQTQVILE